MDIKQELADKLLQINAIKFNVTQPFTWASGIRSPIYCDNRLTLSYVEVRNLICRGFMQLASDLDFDIVGGVATGGIAHGMLLADRLSKPFLYVRSSSKGHGLQNSVEGKMPPGARVLLIEDLVSTGGSSLQAVEAVRSAGGLVDDVLAIVQYGFPMAAAAFDDANVKLSTLTDFQTIVRQGIQIGTLTPDQTDTLNEWSSDPRNWYQNL